MVLLSVMDILKSRENLRGKGNNCHVEESSTILFLRVTSMPKYQLNPSKQHYQGNIGGSHFHFNSLLILVLHGTGFDHSLILRLCDPASYSPLTSGLSSRNL